MALEFPVVAQGFFSPVDVHSYEQAKATFFVLHRVVVLYRFSVEERFGK